MNMQVKTFLHFPVRGLAGGLIIALCVLATTLGAVIPNGHADSKKGTETIQETGAMDIKVGQQYGSGTRVRAPLFGISFVIPEDWLGRMPPASQYFLLGSNSKAGLGIVVMFDHATPQELVEQLNEPQVLEEEFVLQPVGSAKTSADRVTASYHAGENIGRVVAVLGPAQKAVVYLFTGPKEQASYYESLLDRTAASTRFTKIDTTAIVKQWQDLLAGMALKHLEQYSSGVGGGYNRSTVWNLCRDGRFTYTHSSHVTVQVPGGGTSDAGEDHRQGQWRVEVKGTDASLILTEDNGAVTSHALAYDGEKTYLNEERVFRVNSEECP